MDSSLAEKVEYFAHSQYAIDYMLIGAIDGMGNDRVVTSVADLHNAEAANCTISIRSMEKFNRRIAEICLHLRGLYDHGGPISCIAYISQAGGTALPWRRDVNGVWVKVIHGKRIIEFENGAGETSVELCFDESLMVSAGTRYHVINKEPSVALAFMLEPFLEDRVR